MDIYGNEYSNSYSVYNDKGGNEIISKRHYQKNTEYRTPTHKIFG